MRTWKSTGLLDMMKENVLILNDPLPQEIAIALDHGFTVLQPNQIPDARVSLLLLFC
jgi:hypothetical protein